MADKEKVETEIDDFFLRVPNKSFSKRQNILKVTGSKTVKKDENAKIRHNNCL